MAVGRISGPLLKANLLRSGVDLAFETDLLFLKVASPTNATPRVGINTNNPQHELDILGTTRTTDLEVVNEATIGGITFNGNNISSTTNALSFFPGANDFTVYQSKLQIDDIEIQQNRISTTVSNANLELRANGTGTVDFLSNTNIVGNLHTTGNINVDGNVTIGGNITIGNETTDSVVINAGIKSDLLPEVTNTYNLGSSLLRWKDLYVSSVNLADISFNDNVIRTVTSNANLELRASGTGAVRLERVDINENVISTNNEDLIVRPSGTGVVRFDTTQAVTLPRGVTNQRPTGTTGMMRFNTQLNRYEGYDGTNWFNLAGVEDADGDTRITAELTPGANDNTIRFFAGGVLAADITGARVSINNRLQVGGIEVENNTISAAVTNTDLTLIANGTGSVRLENFAFQSNTITNTSSNAVVYLQPNNSGYFKITGTNGFVIPHGPAGSRPSSYAVVGMTRYNTDSGAIEIWNGTVWSNPSGLQGAVNESSATSIAIEKVLQLG